MVIHLVYKVGDPSKEAVANLAKELARYKIRVELVDADSREGIRLVELYDLLSRPAAVLVRDDGSMIKSWQHQLPPAGEVSYLVHG